MNNTQIRASSSRIAKMVGIAAISNHFPNVQRLKSSLLPRAPGRPSRPFTTPSIENGRDADIQNVVINPFLLRHLSDILVKTVLLLRHKDASDAQYPLPTRTKR